jgi:hypothetical protein
MYPYNTPREGRDYIIVRGYQFNIGNVRDDGLTTYSIHSSVLSALLGNTEYKLTDGLLKDVGWLGWYKYSSGGIVAIDTYDLNETLGILDRIKYKR